MHAVPELGQGLLGVLLLDLKKATWADLNARLHVPSMARIRARTTSCAPAHCDMVPYQVAAWQG